MEEGSLGHIFILSMGRSGGTLLKKIINCDTRFEIHGENHGVLRNLMEIDRVMRATRSVSYSGTEKPFTSTNTAWHGYTRYSIRDVVSSVLSFRSDVVSGFKEVRHGGGTFEEFSLEMDFLLSVFPESLLVLNTRDVDGVVRSQVRHWDHGDEACVSTRMEVAKRQHDNFHRYYACNPKQTYLMDYQNIVSCDSIFLKFLDMIDYAHDVEFVRKVLQFNIG